MLGARRVETTEATRYLQLLDCGHILRVEEMDAWMMRQLGSDVELIRCPRCSITITFSYRYGNRIKRTLRNIDKVKTEILELGNKTANDASGLVRRLRHTSEGILNMVKILSRHPSSMALDDVYPPSYPLLFTLKNHLLIMHQIEKAHHSLENVTRYQRNSKGHLEIKQISDTIKDALEKITEYLEKPQLDLRTLDQLHEQTIKFSLFASILETQSQAIKRQIPFSTDAETGLKEVRNKFHSFLEGRNDAVLIDWLESIIHTLRTEVGLAPLPPEEPKDFENFPGFSKCVWKLCEHGQVYFTRSIVRDGKDVYEVSNGCGHCEMPKGE